jgi:hypothetical protein
MSADNWAKCPRCVARAEKELAEREAEVSALYGEVPVDEFDLARVELTQDRAKHDKDDAYRTFREDYEFYGAEDGEVVAVYAGSCKECGLKLNFRHVHPIDVAGAA